jgi:hypothetical protein
MFNPHQEVANFLAVRNRNRAEQEAGGPLPEVSELWPEPQGRWARLQAFLRGLAVRRAKSQPRPLAGEMRAERR